MGYFDRIEVMMKRDDFNPNMGIAMPLDPQSTAPPKPKHLLVQSGIIHDRPDFIHKLAQHPNFDKFCLDEVGANAAILVGNAGLDIQRRSTGTLPSRPVVDASEFTAKARQYTRLLDSSLLGPMMPRPILAKISERRSKFGEAGKEGLGADLLDALLEEATEKAKGVEANEDCAICMEKCTNVSILECGHVYHMHCLDGWLKVQSRQSEELWCPLCRRIVGEEIKGVYAEYAMGAGLVELCVDDVLEMLSHDPTFVTRDERIARAILRLVLGADEE
jgi:hypothetical protein